MATRPVRIEFIFTHNFLSTLIEESKANPSAADPEHISLFTVTIKPVLAQHMQAVFAACQRECCVCGAPATYPTLTPMSWLHKPDPFVNVLACPVCSKPSCNTGARQYVQTIMSEMAGSPDGTDEHDKAEKIKGEVMPCNVCEKVDKTFKCARCKIAYYCGKEYQSQDWPAHKKACKSIASGH